MPSAGPATQRKAAAEPKPQASPTVSQFSAYSAAFDYFNRELFSGELPPCFLNFSRASKSLGFFAQERWTNGGETTHEISLNPDHLGLGLRETMSTLVHEMVHLWQQVLGEPPRRCYHDRQWAEKMEAVGLIPSHTGKPGGKRTGQKMSHYDEPNGPFVRAFEAMPKEYALPWMSFLEDAEGEAKKKRKSSKIKYTCPVCGANAWGKPCLKIMCGECEEEFEAEEKEDD